MAQSKGQKRKRQESGCPSLTIEGPPLNLSTAALSPTSTNGTLLTSPTSKSSRPRNPLVERNSLSVAPCNALLRQVPGASTKTGHHELLSIDNDCCIRLNDSVPASRFSSELYHYDTRPLFPFSSLLGNV